MTVEYKLVNPSIKGTMSTTFKGNNALDVAQKCWNKLSENFANEVPQFAFTMKNTKTNKLSHFFVREGQNAENDETDYTISSLNIKLNKKQEKDIEEKLQKCKNCLRGGKRDYDDDDDDDEFLDMVKYKYRYQRMINEGRFPITWWGYYPYIYGCDSLFIPTFVYPNPYVQIIAEISPLFSY